MYDPVACHNNLSKYGIEKPAASSGKVSYNLDDLIIRGDSSKIGAQGNFSGKQWLDLVDCC